MASIEVGREAPDFSLTDLDGERLSLSEMRGAPMVLNFFHTGCTWCRAMIPQLDNIYDRLVNLDVPILGIVVGEDTPETARAFARENDINILLGVDEDRSIRAAYGLERVPTVVLLDAEGFVVRVYQGSTEQLPGLVEQAIYALARGDEAPEISLVGNGCAP
jgi:peroxiredoxin